MRTHTAQRVVDNFKVPEVLPQNAVLIKTIDNNYRWIYELADLAGIHKIPFKGYGAKRPFTMRVYGELNRDAQEYVADEISKLISNEFGSTVRYTLQPIQYTSDLLHEGGQESKNFLEFVMMGRGVCNLERFRQKPPLVYVDSKTEIEDMKHGRFRRSGIPHSVEIKEDLISTLVDAGLLRVEDGEEPLQGFNIFSRPTKNGLDPETYDGFFKRNNTTLVSRVDYHTNKLHVGLVGMPYDPNFRVTIFRKIEDNIQF